MQMKYRAEIDGLRAIAVIAVILYHAKFTVIGIPVMRGGFLGVDVFFVISGYLITSILLREMNAGSFSYLRFYERRARRILPAFLMVMLVSLPFAWTMMMPKGLVEYAGASLSALGFSSNIWFWLEDSYTAEPSLYKPMLHTWTLAVEEQFYIIFPAILMAIITWTKRYILGALLLGFILSLEIAELASTSFPDATFYLLHTRLWELLGGAILAHIHIDRNREHPPLMRVIMPPIGLLMIIHPMLAFDDTMRHPSFMTLIVVIGTMIIIWYSRKGEIVTDMLASRILVCIGLISYGLYLWHYPIFAFARIELGTLDFHSKAICIGLSVLFAGTSYFLIERPMRYKASLKLFSSTILIATAIIAAINIYIIKTDGAAFRLAKYHAIFDTQETNATWRECFHPAPELGAHCKYLRDSATGTIIGMGDSHLAVLGPSLRALAEKLNMNYEQLPRCVPLLNTQILKLDNSVADNDCIQEQLEYLRSFENAIIVKSSRLTFRITGMGRPDAQTEEFTDQYVLAEGYTHKTQSLDQAITDVNTEILAMGHKLVQIYPVPAMNFPPDYRLKKLLKGHEVDFQERLREVAKDEMTTPYSTHIKWDGRVIDAFDRIQGDRYYPIKPHEMFCDEPGNICTTVMNDRLIYRDNNHVSDYGAELIINEIEGVINAR